MATEIKKRSWWRIGFYIVGGSTLILLVLILLGSSSIHFGPRGGPKGRTNTVIQVLGVVFAEYITDNGSLPPSSENYLLVQTFGGDNPHKTTYYRPGQMN